MKRRKLKAGLLAALVVGMLACPKKQDTIDRMCKNIDNAIETARQICNQISIQAERDKCLRELANNVVQAAIKKNEGIVALCNGERDRAKDILKEILDLFKSAALTLAGNSAAPVSAGDMVALEATAEKTVAMTEGETGLKAPAPSVTSYQLTPNSSIQYDLPSAGHSGASALSGNLDLALIASPAGWQGAIRNLYLAFDFDGYLMEVVLEPASAFNRVSIAPDGTGFLQFHATMQSDDPNVIANIVFLKLPIHTLDPQSSLDIDTGGLIEALQLFPVVVSQVADFNKDGQVDSDDWNDFFALYDAGDSLADVNVDLKVTEEDAQYFMDHYNEAIGEAVAVEARPATARDGDS